MKSLSYISTGIAILAMVLFFYQQSQLSELKKSIGESGKGKKQIAQADETSENESEIEVVHYMTRIQTFHAKLYFSGINHNEELVKFYLHELEEEMEALADANIIDEGINISNNMEIFGVKQIEWFEAELEKNQILKLLSNLLQAVHAMDVTRHPNTIIFR